MADRILVLNDGQVILDGTPSYVFEQEALLKSCGLNVPQCTELVHRLRKEGIALEGECGNAHKGMPLPLNKFLRLRQ